MIDLTRELFARMLEATWQASLLALFAVALQFVPARWLPARWRCALWGIVFLRLLLPALPPSPFSLFNLTPRARPAMLPTPDRVTVTYGVGSPIHVMPIAV